MPRLTVTASVIAAVRAAPLRVPAVRFSIVRPAVGEAALSHEKTLA